MPAEDGDMPGAVNSSPVYDEDKNEPEEEDAVGDHFAEEEAAYEDDPGPEARGRKDREPSSGGRKAKGTDVPGEVAPDEILEEEIRYRILEASADEAFARAFADAVFSFYREKRKIVFAFDAYLGGGQSSKALELVEVVNELKADQRYAGFLENIDVMRFDTTRGERGLKSLRERIDSGALVFSFAADTSQARRGLESLQNDPDHKLSFINEKEVWQLLATEKVYYPLFEIVTITLSRYIDEMNIEDIKEISEEIALRTKQEGGALVFTILPSIRRFETNSELLRHYAMKKKLLLAA
ncbi:MAG: hypothetical protein GF392_01250 [Candidatus Omnitrophica bacterium]|nr:hypothetical protein [Candidatus Omnitrophota bacterium]